MTTRGVNVGERSKRPLVEWVVGGLSTIILIAIVSWLVIQCIWGPVNRSVLRVETGLSERESESSIVTIYLINDGGRLANSVKIVATVTNADNSTTTKDIIFDEIGPGEGKFARLIVPKDYLSVGANIESYIEY